MVKNRVAIAVLVSGVLMPGISWGFGQKTFFGTRSQSVNAVRDLVGWQQEINRFGKRRVCEEVMVYDDVEVAQEPEVSAGQVAQTGWFSWLRSSAQSQNSHARQNRRERQARKKMVCTDEDSMFTVFSITPEYSRSFSGDKIAKTLFGSECLTFSGSRNTNRGKNDILSDYFGLPSDFKSTVSFSPVITNFLMDFGWYHGLDAWLPGLYYRVHMPIVHAKWDLKMCEKVVDAGKRFNTGGAEDAMPPATYPAGYLGPDRIILNDRIPRNVTEAFQGKKVFGDMCDPLRFGKIFGRQTMTRAAEMQFGIGYNFLREDWYHLGASIRVAAPTGNRPDAEFLFEPIVGNGGHWELGAGLSGHVQMWESDDAWHKLALYCDVNVSHLFNSTQKRSFDFTKNGNGSRYMLLTDISSPSKDLSVAGPPVVEAANQYQRRLVPAINKTTLDSKISVGAQIDFVLKLAYQRDNLEIDFGYNLWARTKEKISRCDKFESGRFGVKGDAQLYGFDENDCAVPLNATQSGATIKAGQGEPNVNYTNENADNFAEALDLNNLNDADAGALNNVIQNPVNLSNPVILLQDSDLNICSGLLPRAISHKVFTHINYAWRDCEDYTPYLGAGVSGEWADTCATDNSAHSQWAIWVKGGLSY